MGILAPHFVRLRLVKAGRLIGSSDPFVVKTVKVSRFKVSRF